MSKSVGWMKNSWPAANQTFCWTRIQMYSIHTESYSLIPKPNPNSAKICLQICLQRLTCPSCKAKTTENENKLQRAWSYRMILSLTVPLAFWPLRVNQCIKSCWIIWCTICDPYSPSKKNGQIRRILSCTMLECICTKTFAKLLSRRITVPTWRQPSNWTILGRTPNSCCTLSRFGWSSACHCWRQSCPANPCIAGLRGAQALFGGFWKNLLLYLSLLTRQVRHPSK